MQSYRDIASKCGRALVMEICNKLVSAGLVLQDAMAYLDGYGGCGRVP